MMNKMKKIATMTMAIMMIAALAACGSTDNNSSSSMPVEPPVSNSPSSLPETSTPAVDESANYDATAQLYSGAIAGARGQDLNDAYGVFTHDEAYNMSTYRNNYTDMKKEDGSDFTEEEMLESHKGARDMQLSLLGLTAADVENYAISVSPMNTKAYGVAIVKPAAGKEETVKAAMENFVTVQQKNFENYLADQFEIAKAGYVKTMEDGTLVLVMGENQDAVYESISKALTANK